MRKTKDEELLDEPKTEKKPVTKKESSTKKASTTSKSKKNNEKSSDEAISSKTTKKAVSAASKTKKASAASAKKTATKTKAAKPIEDIEPIVEIVEKPKKKSSSTQTTKTTTKTKSTSTKKTTTKTTSTKKSSKARADEKSITEKTTTTRKKRTSSKPADLKVEKTENIEKIEKVEIKPVYINPDILKFEERLKKAKTSSTSTHTIESENQIDLEDIEKDITLENLESPIVEKNPEVSAKEKDNTISKNNSEKKSISAEKSLEKTKSNKRFNVNYIYNTIIAICIILILYSAINIILWQKNNIDNSKLIQQVSEITPVTETSSVVINENLQIEKKSYDFTELLNQNSDTVGWIHLNNTDIDYPVVKAQDNDFYLTHAFDKSYNAAGWIYADYRNRCDDTDTNLIIYGHNRLNDNMFGTLENVLSNPWLADENNHYIHYSSINKSHIYSIFSVFICTSDDSINYLRTSFSSNTDFTEYINNLKSHSTYDFNVNLTENDKIITLYTCHGLNNERLIVCGKLIN